VYASVTNIVHLSASDFKLIHARKLVDCWHLHHGICSAIQLNFNKTKSVTFTKKAIFFTNSVVINLALIYSSKKYIVNQHKPSFDKECLKLLDQRKRVKLQ
jgi:hypothetical protein